ncbi:MAG: ester cyclase [Thermoflexales bacterium]
MNAKQTVTAHLRAIEAGDWDKANSYIADDFSMTGTVPFPVSLFVKIGKKDALRMHIPRRKAMPDFRFNETVLEETDDRVKIQVNLSGTHTGVIDYTGVLRGVPVIPPTGKKVNLPAEYFTWFVRDGKIAKVIAEIPKGAGVQGLVRAVKEAA